MKKFIKTIAVAVVPIMLTACLGQGTKQGAKPAAAKATVETAAAAKTASVAKDFIIADVLLDVPKINLTLQKENRNPNGSVIRRFNVGKLDDASSPVRLIYQRIVPAVDAVRLREQLLKPYTQNCSDIKQAEFELNTKYPRKNALETICAKYGAANYGALTHTVIFSDATANHLIFTEIKTPASAKAGVLDFKTEEQKQQAMQSAELIRLMQEMAITARVCDAQNNCL